MASYSNSKADTTGASYQPNTKFLNERLEGQENRFLGIVHSHPASFRGLSRQDERAAWSNLTSPSNPHLNAYLMPIIMTTPDTGAFEIIPYVVVCHPCGNGGVIVNRVPLEIVSGAVSRKKKACGGAAAAGQDRGAEELQPWKKKKVTKHENGGLLAKGTPEREELDTKYARISRDIDFARISKITLFVVGAGASGQMVESFARIGVRRFYLFDHDIVEAKNLAVQNFVHTDIGARKVEALAQRLKEVEFEAGNHILEPLTVKLGDDFLSISDDTIAGLIEAERSAGRRVIFVMATDNHYAQARGNRIALRFRVLSFFVGINAGGRGGEIVFFDGRRHAKGFSRLPCFRCIVSPRFEKRKNAGAGMASAVSHASGLPWAASFVDSVLSHLIVGAIHSGMPDNRHGAFYDALVAGKQNYVALQMDPTYDANDSYFGHLTAKPAAPGARQKNWIRTFNSLFKDWDVRSGCPDCSVGFGQGEGGWQETRYAIEEPTRQDASHSERTGPKAAPIKFQELRPARLSLPKIVLCVIGATLGLLGIGLLFMPVLLKGLQ